MKEEIRLSDRLQAVAGMVTKGNVVCDVGCDHGFVSIYLVQKGISPKVIAMDVNEGPLQAAKEHIGACLLADYIETRLSDGVTALEAGEADTLICAGMGGRLMIKILEEGKEKIRGMKELVLQPQSELQAVREYLRGQGYLITDENMIEEEGKYYPMMKIMPIGGMKVVGCVMRAEEVSVMAGRDDSLEETRVLKQRIQDKYGPFLLRQKHPVLKEFLQRELRICKQIMDNLQTNGKDSTERQKEILDKMKDVEEALTYYE